MSVLKNVSEPDAVNVNEVPSPLFVCSSLLRLVTLIDVVLTFETKSRGNSIILLVVLSPKICVNLREPEVCEPPAVILN